MSDLFRNFPLRTGLGLGLPPFREAQISQSSLAEFRRARDADKVDDPATDQSEVASATAEGTIALAK